jgi:D-glycero-beta-D-manno-heptose-7-phosphate kinase
MTMRRRPAPSGLAAAAVLVVGDAMLDQYWFGDVDRVSPEAPVPVVLVKREEFRLGGAANVALNVASLGGTPRLVSVVGQDAAAERMRFLLDEAAIRHDLRPDASVQTTVKLRVSGRAQQLLRIDFEDRPCENTLEDLADVLEQHVLDHQVVVFSDYGKGCLAQIERKIDVARRHARPVLIDPKGRDWERYRGATLITPNRAELIQVVGAWRDDAELHDRAHALREQLSLEALLVTRSEEGMTLFDRDGHLDVPAQAREVFDVTGAGDTVLATLATMLAAGETLRDAVLIANRAGGVVVGKFGTSAITASELFA